MGLAENECGCHASPGQSLNCSGRPQRVSFANEPKSSRPCNTAAIEYATPCAKSVEMRKKILVVEDDVELVELLSYQLKKAGFAIGTAMDGIEALKKARSVTPDLILLDLMLPELDGFAVCEILRRDAATASIPIIMVTALSTHLARLAGLEAGANAYVTKPFEFKGLLNQIKALLSPHSESPAPQATSGHFLHSYQEPL